MRKKLSKLTNAELKIKLTDLTNEYEAHKKNISENIEKIESIKEDIKIIYEELSKRMNNLWTGVK